MYILFIHVHVFLLGFKLPENECTCGWSGITGSVSYTNETGIWYITSMHVYSKKINI